MAIITVAIMTTVMRIIATTPPIIVALSSSSVAKLNSVVVAQNYLIYSMTYRYVQKHWKACCYTSGKIISSKMKGDIGMA